MTDKSKNSMGFLKDFRKKIEKNDNITMDFNAPTFWYSTGNLALNKLLSGSFTKGIPQGRISVLAGPSGTGKSYLGCNILREAQKQGAFILVLDSENALDENFVSNIGVNTDPENFMYSGVVTIQDVTGIMSDFIKGYEKEHGRNNPDAPKVVVFLDSIDMLLTNSEDDNFDKGDQKGDMGQRTKLVKHLLRTIVSRISRLNITFIATHQTYMNQNILDGTGAYVVNNGIRYSASLIGLITKLKLKDGKIITGIRMRVEAYKSRFSQPNQKVEIEVPYLEGMNPYSGFVEMMLDDGVITQGGAWYTLELPNEEPIKFQKKNLDDILVEKIMSHPIVKKQEDFAQEIIDGDTVDSTKMTTAKLED